MRRELPGRNSPVPKALNGAPVKPVSGSPRLTAGIRPAPVRDPRLLVGILLMFLAAGGMLYLWNLTQKTYPELAAARDLPAGAIISEADLSVVRLPAGSPELQFALGESHRQALTGKRTLSPIRRGDLLRSYLLVESPDVDGTHEAITVAVTPNTALNGRLAIGDVVDVLVSERTRPQERARVVAQRVTIAAIGYAATGSGTSVSLAVGGASSPTQVGAAGAISNLTLLVTPDQAALIAAAKAAGQIDVVLRVRGASATAPPSTPGIHASPTAPLEVAP